MIFIYMIFIHSGGTPSLIAPLPPTKTDRERERERETASELETRGRSWGRIRPRLGGFCQVAERLPIQKRKSSRERERERERETEIYKPKTKSSLPRQPRREWNCEKEKTHLWPYRWLRSTSKRTRSTPYTYIYIYP